MDFSLTSEQEELRSLAARVLADRCTPEHLKEVAFGDGSTGVDLELWRELAELGLVGVGLPESAGGGGMGFTEVAIVLEEVGRAVAPVPALPVMAMAGPFLARHAPDQLTGLATGERIVTVALHDPLGDIATPALAASGGALSRDEDERAVRHRRARLPASRRPTASTWSRRTPPASPSSARTPPTTSPTRWSPSTARPGCGSPGWTPSRR